MAAASAAILVGTTASANDASLDDSPVPRDQRAMPVDGTWLKSEQMPAAMQDSFKKFDGLISFPNEKSRATVQGVIKNSEFDDDGLYEDGMQDQLVLDEWTCAWADAAKTAAANKDTKGVQEAASNLMTRIDLPGQRSMHPDWDRYSVDILEPMLKGNYDSVSSFWGFQCFGTDGAEFNEAVNK